MIKIEFNIVSSDTPGKFIRRKGTDIYASAILLTDPTLTAEDFEEVDEISQATDTYALITAKNITVTHE